MQETTRRKASRFVSDLKPLFPGYMFVSVNSELAPWRTINNTIGVSRLVSFDGKPKPLPLQLVSALMLRCDASGALLPPKSLELRGIVSKCSPDPFANFIATVDTN